MLSSEKFCFDVNFNQGTFKMNDKSVCIIGTQMNPLFRYDTMNWPIIGVILDCDYLKMIPNVGYATMFNKILPKIVSWEAE